MGHVLPTTESYIGFRESVGKAETFKPRLLSCDVLELRVGIEVHLDHKSLPGEGERIRRAYNK